mmetsp:Transcript_10175/g.23968  ORF Transcript_10175/g.23968 Transcript_10175/m.23968 type:complete len:207 (-) Transcript_10175:518-1138(-)
MASGTCKSCSMSWPSAGELCQRPVLRPRITPRRSRSSCCRARTHSSKQLFTATCAFCRVRRAESPSNPEAFVGGWRTSDAPGVPADSRSTAIAAPCSAAAASCRVTPRAAPLRAGKVRAEEAPSALVREGTSARCGELPAQPGRTVVVGLRPAPTFCATRRSRTAGRGERVAKPGDPGDICLGGGALLCLSEAAPNRLVHSGPATC